MLGRNNEKGPGVRAVGGLEMESPRSQFLVGNLPSQIIAPEELDGVIGAPVMENDEG